MFYSLTILTLLASILFYSFYPRNDGIKTQDIPDAKSYAAEMLSHHLAAVDAARVLSYDSTTHLNKMAYESWTLDNELDAGEGQGIIKYETYSAYLPPNFVDHGIRPALYCIDNADGTTPATCGNRTANITEAAVIGNNYGSSDYIVTLVNVDNMDNLLVERALGEKMLLTSYSKEKHLRTLCGVLEPSTGAGRPDEDFDYYGTCIVSNTRYTTVALPRGFECSDNPNSKGLTGYLVCITQISAAYNGTEKIYPQ